MRIVAWLALTACGNPNFPPELPLDPAFTTCQTAEDCVVVELGCCDDCNGGLAVATNADSAEQVRDTFSESCGGSVACSLMACADPVITCDEGTCAWTPGSFE